jgi:hypothetical protein
LTTGRVCVGTRQAVSLHRRNVAEDEIEMTKIYAMSSAAEMHALGSKIDVRSASALNRGSIKKWTMIIMVPIMTNLTNIILPKGAQCRRSQGIFP